MKKYFFLLVALMAIFVSCNNASETATPDSPEIKTSDTTAPVPAPLPPPPSVDSAKTRPVIILNGKDTGGKNATTETTSPPPGVTKQKKSAVLGYSYFRHMRQDETRNIYAHVLAVNTGDDIDRLAEKIKVNLEEANSQVKPERRSDTASYFSDENIFFYKYLTITLNDPNNNFKVDSLGIPPRQLIDTSESTLWQWAVTPKTSVKNARLILKVVAEKEDGSQKPIGTREIAITIQLETNFWRVLITWLRNNPEKLLVLILIPLAGYFGKKLFDQNKVKKENPGGVG